MGRALGSLGPAGRAQQYPHEPAFTVEHDDRLEAELVVERIEQAQVLVAIVALPLNLRHGALSVEFCP
jgi:hypothetical protein